jgi:2-polyprenyl-3-methyl-5-hydroxy-6-metoxy-1,4-benzoquinol methylase
MAGYHKYVFDQENQGVVGKFEEMYQAEDVENFDSWHQDDMRLLTKQISLVLLNRYNFNNVLDVGCGKGAFTHLLKKENNQVTGIDVSKTAIKRAKAKFTDISFSCVDLTKDSFKKMPFFSKHYDLIVFMEVLSYLRNWSNVIEEFSRIGEYVLITSDIPENPIGYVKSKESLKSVVQRHYEIIDELYLSRFRKTILFCKSLRLK